MNDELNGITAGLLSVLREKLNIGAAFNLWFDGLTLISLDDKLAVFTSPSTVRTSVLLARYRADIVACLTEVIGFEVKVDIYCVEEEKKNEVKIYSASTEEIEIERELEETRRVNGTPLLSDSDFEDLEKKNTESPKSRRKNQFFLHTPLITSLRVTPTALQRRRVWESQKSPASITIRFSYTETPVLERLTFFTRP